MAFALENVEIGDAISLSFQPGLKLSGRTSGFAPTLGARVGKFGATCVRVVNRLPSPMEPAGTPCARSVECIMILLSSLDSKTKETAGVLHKVSSVTCSRKWIIAKGSLKINLPGVWFPDPRPSFREPSKNPEHICNTMAFIVQVYENRHAVHFIWRL